MKKVKLFTIYFEDDTEGRKKYGYNIQIVAKDFMSAYKALGVKSEDVTSFNSSEVYIVE